MTQATLRGQTVAGFILKETLGEGSFGKVKLGCGGDDDPTQVAIKIVDVTKFDRKDVKKERAVHALCSKHVNVVRFLDFKESPSLVYLVLELADGGELFDRIVPDKGMVADVAHFYFWQLINVVMFLNTKGVVHRDIKPENILLDSFGNLKLTDFGFATVFRHKGIERKLDKKCGTPPYVAPEIYGGHKYDGNLTDYWSCGVVLITLLAGCLPWNRPSKNDADFSHWVCSKHTGNNWYAVVKQRGAYELLLQILNPKPDLRAGGSTIRKDPWFTRKTDILKLVDASGMIRETVKALTVDENKMVLNESICVSQSEETPLQPEQHQHQQQQQQQQQHQHQQQQHKRRRLDSDESDDVKPSRPKVKRDSCFTSRLGTTETIDSIVAALDILGMETEYTVLKDKHIIVVAATDCNGDALEFSAKVFSRGGGKQLVDFRLGKNGDGLEFRRRFADVCDILFKRDSFNLCTQTQFQTQA